MRGALLLNLALLGCGNAMHSPSTSDASLADGNAGLHDAGRDDGVATLGEAGPADGGDGGVAHPRDASAADGGATPDATCPSDAEASPQISA
jgi:hypothetical protein